MSDAAPSSDGRRTSETRANAFIEGELRKRLEDIENSSQSHALCVIGPIYAGLDDFVRDLLENRKKDDPSQSRLTFLLTTHGGQVEPVVRIVETTRHHYEHVSFVVPNYAYSAGTILALSGDQIFMDYYARLGPIDPQVRNQRGQFVPALGYLQRWDELLAKAANGTLTTAEVQVMLDFDQAELYMYEQAKAQSVDLLIEWLQLYKFKNWMVTETQGTQVTDDMRRDRAQEVAEILSNSGRWHSHGRGISREVLARDVGLQIDDLADHPDFYDDIKAYDHLLNDFMSVRGSGFALQVITSDPIIG